MGYFPAARRPKPAKATKRQPKRWRTHVATVDGTKDFDDEPICSTCGMRREHRVHDLNHDIAVDAAEMDARRLGEGGDG